ncbi:MAG: flavodoxin, partial [Methanomicrobiales archaeon]|nr:flavodoxin [Methanomicrobiales archaeon]
RKMIGMVKSPTGDFRNWEAIAAWARGLPPLLAKG